jgi:hypothetical protein
MFLSKDKTLVIMRHTSLRWLLLIVALIGLGVLLVNAPFADISYWGIDVYTYRAAAKAMMMGADPYFEPNILRFADGATVGNIHDYIYAPYFAFALRPLAWLSPETASRVWFPLNLAWYFASVGLLLLAMRWHPVPKTYLVIIGALILFPPLRTTLIIGQSTILLLFFFSLSLFLFSRQRLLLSGLALSLGLFKPHLFPLLLFFALYGQWRWLLGVGLGLVALNLPFLDWMDNWIFAVMAVHDTNLAPSQCFQMVSLGSLLNCILPWPNWLTMGLLGALSLGLLITFWQISPGCDTSSEIRAQIFERHFALFVTLSVLLIDHTRIADQMLLVFPLLVIWRDWHVLEKPVIHRIAVALMLFIYILPYALDILGPKQIAFILPFWYIGLSGAVLGLLILEWRAFRESTAS